MTSPVTPLQIPALREAALSSPTTTEAGTVGGTSFAKQLAEAVSEVDRLQKDATERTEAFGEGRSNDLHGTMIALEKADISLRMLANVRNRVIDAYREIMRMGA